MDRSTEAGSGLGVKDIDVESGSQEASQPPPTPPPPQGRSRVQEADDDVADHRPCFWKYITAITRIWAFVTLGALWFCTVRMIQHRADYEYTHWYMLAVTIVLTFFEFVWLINKCACCKDTGNCCCACWRIIVWIDNWKKGLVYLCLAIPTFTETEPTILAIICGILIIVLGCFYFLKSFKYSKCVENQRRPPSPQPSIVETTSPKAKLVTHEVQTDIREDPASSQTYSSIGQTVPVQPVRRPNESLAAPQSEPQSEPDQNGLQ